MTQVRPTLLIVEDNELNRDILNEILKDEYKTYLAENGAEGLRLLRQHSAEIDLVLLDIEMPVMNGYDVLKAVRFDPELKDIPIIIITANDSVEEEVRCLKLGAKDFIRKPFNATVAKLRINSIVDMQKSATTLSKVELDAETDVYTFSAFLHYAKELLRSNPDTSFAISITHIKGFRGMRSLLGEEAMEYVKKEAAVLREMIPNNAICGRFFLERFIVLSPMMPFSKENRVEAYNRISRDMSKKTKARIKISVLENVSGDKDLTTLIEQANAALNSIQDLYHTDVCFVEDDLVRQLENRYCIERNMENALRQGEFKIYFQPKHRSTDGQLIGAEALLRWINPEMGFISPAVFIPIFEQSGFVVDVDSFAWETVCRYQREWADSGLKTVPVSVNTSRFDYTTSHFRQQVLDSIARHKVPTDMLHIEVTESLLAELTKDALATLHSFREKGIKIELDDFGTGYSSPHALVELPIDIVKLDMSFVRKLDDPREQQLMKGCVFLFKSLNLESVAEGVETEETRKMIADFGIDCIQGYYYSKPLPADEFEMYLRRHSWV